MHIEERLQLHQIRDVLLRLIILCSARFFSQSDLCSTCLLKSKKTKHHIANSKREDVMPDEFTQPSLTSSSISWSLQICLNSGGHAMVGREK